MYKGSDDIEVDIVCINTKYTYWKCFIPFYKGFYPFSSLMSAFQVNYSQLVSLIDLEIWLLIP